MEICKIQGVPEKDTNWISGQVLAKKCRRSSAKSSGSPCSQSRFCLRLLLQILVSQHLLQNSISNFFLGHPVAFQYVQCQKFKYCDSKQYVAVTWHWPRETISVESASPVISMDEGEWWILVNIGNLQLAFKYAKVKKIVSKLFLSSDLVLALKIDRYRICKRYH